MTEDEDVPGYTLKDLQEIGKKWVDRIRAREEEKEIKQWLDDAEKAENEYLAVDRDKQEFNILHSNVETIVPSIYNSTPAPEIKPRHNQKDPVAKSVSDVIERAIVSQIDDSRLDSEIEMAAQDVFVAGLAVVRVKFDADVVQQPVLDPMMGQPVLDPETYQPVTQDVVTNERLIYENVSWRDYRWGPCKRFEQRPWEAFRHCISQDDLDAMEDGEIADVYAREAGTSPTAREELDVDVWEIWCLEDRTAYFIVADSAKVLKIEKDPLGVGGFYSVRSPMVPIHGSGKTTPVCPYVIYKTLADEMNTATKRIRGLMRGIKARALVAGVDGGDMDRLAEADDNEFVFASNLENLAATGGLEKGVLWWPIQQSIVVLKELYVQREQTKAAIYEITGISDIVRGASNAGETATAQQIKTQWGSLRVKKMQRLIERQVRDIFVLSAEIISKHFGHETLQKMTGIQITPEMQQFLGKAMDHYRIDVESDSTIRADLTKSRGEMSEFLQGTAQFFQVVAPIIAQAPAAAGPIADMYAAFARQFNLGKSAEDSLEQFVELAKQAASQPKPNPDAERMQAEMELEKAKLQLDEKGQQNDMLLGVFDRMLKRQELAQKGDELKLDEAKAEFDAIARSEKLDQPQERPARAV